MIPVTNITDQLPGHESQHLTQTDYIVYYKLNV